jgi:DNA-binding response OmpR family regulator
MSDRTALENATDASATGGAGPVVCVIDDDARLREAICSILKHAGYTTVQADDGAVGLEVVARENPAVVLTDIVMPNREGIETIQLLKDKFPHIPVLAMSGSHSPGRNYLEWAEAIGADDCVAKPFGPAELLRKIGALIARAA